MMLKTENKNDSKLLIFSQWSTKLMQNAHDAENRNEKKKTTTKRKWSTNTRHM
jgi:hypothetical protein